MTASMAACGQVVPARPLEFDVVSIRPSHLEDDRGLMEVDRAGDTLVVTNAPMGRILEFAFDRQRSDLVEDAAGRTSIFTAMEEQLGLRLSATRATVDALVVERIDRPGAN